MADPVARETLVVSPTKREAAVAGAEASVGDLDTDLIRRAGSPDIAQVPAAYLPARAQARSVDVWDESWPDDIKRSVILAAPDVHRHKGTVYAVKAALAALRIDATVTEWWQQTPRGAPYTFSVLAHARARLYDGPLLDARLINAAYATVLRVKPESRAFDLSIGVGFEAPQGFAAIGVATAQLRQTAHVPATIAVTRTLGLAAIGTARATHRAAIRLSANP